MVTVLMTRAAVVVSQVPVVVTINVDPHLLWMLAVFAEVTELMTRDVVVLNRVPVVAI